MKFLKVNVRRYDKFGGEQITPAIFNLDCIVMITRGLENTTCIFLTNDETYTLDEALETILDKIESLNKEHPEP